MGTRSRAAPRLESGATDARASTLERYAAGHRRRDHGSLNGVIRKYPAACPPLLPRAVARRSRGAAHRFRAGLHLLASPARRPDPGPVPATRVWLDPQAGWHDTLYERLLKQRIVLASGVLDDAAATRMSAQLLTLDARATARSGWSCRTCGPTCRGADPDGGCRRGARGVHAYAAARPAAPRSACSPRARRRLAYPNASFTCRSRGCISPAPHAVTPRAAGAADCDPVLPASPEVTGRDAEEVPEDARQGRRPHRREAIATGWSTSAPRRPPPT